MVSAGPDILDAHSVDERAPLDTLPDYAATLAGVLAKWPGLRVLEDDWAFDLETVARHLTCDPDRPPLAVACNGKGQAVYGVSGYHVGSVELLTRIAAHLCEEKA